MQQALVDTRRRALALGLLAAPLLSLGARGTPGPVVPVLAYHRFAPTAVDSMTVRTSNFEAHLAALERLQCTVIALSDWVAWRTGERATLPPRAVVLTVDDGHQSQFETMAPLLRARGWPVTLFIYPSAISNASYAMTWSQLRELQATPGFSIQSHTYWHPNFLQQRKHLSPDAYRNFAKDQLYRSRNTLAQRLGQAVSLLAWPFGWSDQELWTLAGEAGYRAAFALGNRAAVVDDPVYAVPRHLMVDGVTAQQLAARLRAAFAISEVS